MKNKTMKTATATTMTTSLQTSSIRRGELQLASFLKHLTPPQHVWPPDRIELIAEASQHCGLLLLSWLRPEASGEVAG